jgi:hypothetical protein
MSKKETRRAARQAFPKAKTGTGARTGTGGVRAKGSGGSKNRGPARGTPRPPSLRRAVIQGIILALLYFLFIQFVPWGTKAPTSTNLIVAVLGFLVFAAAAFAADKFKYQRYLRKRKGSSK